MFAELAVENHGLGLLYFCFELLFVSNDLGNSLSLHDQFINVGV